MGTTIIKDLNSMEGVEDAEENQRRFINKANQQKTWNRNLWWLRKSLTKEQTGMHIERIII